MKEEILELLGRSFDSSLSDVEQRQLEEALAESPELRAEKARVEALRKAVSSSVATSFDPFFADRVMQRIREEQTEGREESLIADSLIVLFRRVAAVAAVLTLSVMSYNLFSSESKSFAAAIGFPQETISDVLESPYASLLEES